MKKFLSKIGTKTWWAITCIFAFASIISFFQINSAWADDHHFNGIFGWSGLGVIFGLVALTGLYHVNKLSGQGKQES
jgi:hypothetical protein